MYKKTFILTLLTVALFACNSKSKESKAEAEVITVNVSELIGSLDQNVDKVVVVSGTVDHVCSHSGRRAFLIDSTGEQSIRIEAAGDIESFGKELVGSNLKVKCVIKEDRLTADDIQQKEAAVLEKHPEDAEADGENCSIEMQNIKQMRQWMKDNGKDYYATYYAEGISYEVAD
ncbi:hypothetical protein [Saccharicrinis sp. FJH54]|uniref:hypothetical protein n=1 Tax=Saccharicrinis sp. FJH54 TaxID=3344665 RepID=UPI0035D4B1C4